jgi:hypothetical protein
MKGRLEKCNQELESTGKKAYPRLNIKPAFIASDKVPSAITEFYRKAATTFLREFLLKKKQYEVDLRIVDEIK